MTETLVLDQITKIFGQTVANSNVSLTVRAGEIHGLLGENGAGKTTLMRMVYGLYRPDRGRIFVHGVERSIGSPRDAMDLGIGMVHQRFTLVPILTVAENIALGLHTGILRVRLGPVIEKVNRLSDAYKLHVDPLARIEHLSVGQRQRVEIIKALYRDIGILILDEPTSLLTPAETERLFQVMHDLRSEGRAIIFITHKLGEVLSIADRITVLRGGRVQGTLQASAANERVLAQLMVGEESVAAFSRRASGQSAGSSPRQILVRTENVTVLDRRHAVLKDVSIEVGSGEILGIAGVEGNGQHELAEVLAGIRRPDKGKVIMCGRDLAGLKRRALSDLGLGFMPEDPQKAGLVMTFSVEDNLVLRPRNRRSMSVMGLLDNREITQLALKLMTQFGIVAPSPKVLVRQLSGGNQQRVVLARELQGNPRVIIAAQPTRGLDVAATNYVHGLIQQHRQHGAATVLISTNLDEIFALSDRIAVLYRGNLMGVMSSVEADRQMIGLMMGGKKPEQAIDEREDGADHGRAQSPLVESIDSGG